MTHDLGQSIGLYERPLRVGWASYFFAKLILYWFGAVNFDPLWNGLFLFVLITPTPSLLNNSVVKIMRSLVQLVAAVLLFWRDSFLPNPMTSLSFLLDASVRPTFDYTLDFVGRYYDPIVWLALLTMMWICVRAAQNKIRFTPVIVLCLALISVQKATAFRHQNFSNILNSFYLQEARRVVRFSPPQTVAKPFDIILIHVCSLGWDDLEVVGRKQDPFWNRFNYILTDFNTVTSYSNPSAHRLLRAPCGQETHKELYREVPDNCLLLENFRRSGYRTYAANDHDGTYSRFSEETTELDHADAPLELAGLPITRINFDQSAIYDDFDVLNRWFQRRLEDATPRAALYFNAVTLHDGAHFAEDANWWKMSPQQRYNQALDKLFSDLGHFFDVVSNSGHSAVVFFIPEHGLGLRGSAVQAAGLRDIPLPSLTQVPVAIKLINLGGGSGNTVMINTPASYLSFAQVLSQMIAQPTFPSEADIRQAIASQSRHGLIMENNDQRVAKVENQFYLTQSNLWIALKPSLTLSLEEKY